MYGLSEVIGHKLSKAVSLLLAEVKEYAVTSYTQLQLSLLLLFRPLMCATKCSQIKLLLAGAKEYAVVSFLFSVTACPTFWWHTCTAGERWATVSGLHGVVCVPNQICSHSLKG